MYGKIADGKMISSPLMLRHNGRTYINPTAAVLEAEGYVKLTFTPCPSAEDGYCYRDSWSDDGVQSWEKVEDGSEAAQTKKRLTELEDALVEVAGLTDNTEITERLDEIDSALVELAELLEEVE